MSLTLATGHTFSDGDTANSSNLNAMVNSATYTGSLEVAKGGTGATTAAGAQTNLGLGSIATQAANSVAITGGTISNANVSSLAVAIAVADGGTGATTASAARTNLGLGTIATQAANSVAITGGTISNSNVSSLSVAIAVADGGTGSTTAAGARTNLGLGTVATQAASAIAITGGTISGATLSSLGAAIAIADGGTGATSAAAARTNLAVPQYATGTWTPSVGGTATYTNQVGYYTQLGNLVFISGHLTINAIGTGSTNVISGLPVASARNDSICVAYFNGFVSANPYYLSALTANSTLTLRGLFTLSTGMEVANIMANSTDIYFSGCYMTS